MATAKMSLAQEFIDEHGQRNAPAAFARGLMAGDPAKFKAGYTADNAYLATLDAFELEAEEDLLLRGALGLPGLPGQREQASAEQGMETCGCGATKPSECCAAVEGYFTSLGQRSDAQLLELADGDGCEAARVALRKREAALSE